MSRLIDLRQVPALLGVHLEFGDKIGIEAWAESEHDKKTLQELNESLSRSRAVLVEGTTTGFDPEKFKGVYEVLYHEYRKHSFDPRYMVFHLGLKAQG